jgi:hypothetical protein
MATTRTARERADFNLDPITDEPGAHPIGTGVGAALGGAAAGAAGGAVAGPVGAAVGAVGGAVAGGLAGKAAAESLDPTAEEAYWRTTYASRPYYAPDVQFSTYLPAYRYGWESSVKHQGRRFEDVEPTLQSDWEASKPAQGLKWREAKPAIRDAWDRIASRNASCPR